MDEIGALINNDVVTVLTTCILEQEVLWMGFDPDFECNSGGVLSQMNLRSPFRKAWRSDIASRSCCGMSLMEMHSLRVLVLGSR